MEKEKPKFVKKDKEVTCGGCGRFGVLFINITLGALCFDYCLYSLTGKDIPWYGDILCGLFFGEIAIPFALLCLILRMFLDVPILGN